MAIECKFKDECFVARFNGDNRECKEDCLIKPYQEILNNETKLEKYLYEVDEYVATLYSSIQAAYHIFDRKIRRVLRR